MPVNNEVLPRMPPAREERLLQLGCMSATVLLVGCCCLTYFVDRSFLWGLGIPIALLAVIIWINGRRQKRQLDEALRAAFQGFEGEVPTLEKTHNFGYSHFTVCFISKEEMYVAFESGHLKTFREFVVDLYGHSGFDPEKGFDESYLGWESDFRESMKIDPSGKQWIDEKLRLRSLHYGVTRNQHDAEQ